jgi:5-formyltetrahydrofolate cyclo-ligase
MAGCAPESRPLKREWQDSAMSEPHWSEIRHWRVEMRKRLIGQRLSLDPAARQAQGEAARRHLLERVDLRGFQTLGIYWPVRGEMDVRNLAIEHLKRGGRVGLPVVVTKSAPVEFWNWRPEMPMRRGIWNIPIPEQREVVTPEALIVPLVGFDGASYRLGYGGGYYDRTIAAAARRPYCVGLGFEAGRLESIFPQAHDIAMSLIVTDAA